MAQVLYGSNGSARILCRRANGVVELLKVYSGLAEALAECNLLIDRHLHRLRSNRQTVIADSSRPREIYVERWLGSDTQGAWIEVQSGDFSGQVYGRLNPQGELELVTPRVRFVFLDQVPRSLRNGQKDRSDLSDSAVDGSIQDHANTQEPSTLHRGVNVTGILTGRTRKNGWFAKLTCGLASGPITNSDQVPADSEVGQIVTLRLNGFNLEKGFASFRWVPKIKG